MATTTLRCGKDLQVGDLILFGGAHRIERFDDMSESPVAKYFAPGLRSAVCENGWRMTIDPDQRFTQAGEPVA